ncbi:hypothetical protein A3H38_06820 [candidate division WOR-1 bacterium RIFCSPLOWO2_02_FULL_46_20]|uniref:Fibronectin type-III domain-containing protein n=2 Tax=Saganbacteria TaxID=1703751 RepID=A0A1F4RCI0_UNCSA|nr:MAG: hypothetical protein A3H38_06820 [candidate division WOR-1 bacterium RIFCSPLOWO2_02_FULL_46_20]OGC08094.1 MAG: hypothetical protein A3F86_01260 [candidate division WOR-1 bacterium RIFCSPLOWO2_12_FULL_45_9]
MRKLLIFIFVGGILCSSALADLEFLTPKVDGYSSPNLEVGANASIIVKFSTTAPANVDAVKLYIDYESAFIEQNSISITNLNPGKFTVSESNLVTPGLVRYQLRTNPEAGQSPLAVSSAANLIQINFHVKQTAAAGTETYFIRFTVNDQINNVRVVDSGNDVTGQRIDPTGANAIHIKTSSVPTFAGINTVVDQQTGNTLNLNWTSNGSSANDLDTAGGAATYYAGHDGSHSGGGLRFNIYRGLTNPFSATSPLVPTHNAFTYINSGLNDGTEYFYLVRAQDDCTPTRNEEQNNLVVSDIPTDHTPPSAPTLTASAGNQRLQLAFGGGGGDVGGYLIIRYLTSPSGAPTLVSARDNDSDSNGQEHGDIYAVGATLNGGKVIYNGNGSSYSDTGAELEDSHLVNGTRYYYQIFAYDPVDGSPRQQGRNYSSAANASGIPGVAPQAVKNFFAYSSFEADGTTSLYLFWDKPVGDSAYGGVAFIYTTDLENKWDWYSTWGSGSVPLGLPPDADANRDSWVTNLAAGNIKILAVADSDAIDSLVVRQDVVGTALNLNSVYFIKAFSYNKTGVPFLTAGTSLTDSSMLDSVLRDRRFSDPVTAAVRPGVPSAGETIVRGGGVQPITFSFTKVEGGLGINPFTILPVPPVSVVVAGGAPRTVSTIGDFIDAIDYEGAGTVAAIGWMAHSQIVGYYMTGAGFTGTEGGGIDADPHKELLVRGRAYQISVLKNVEVVVSEAVAE